MLVGCIVGSYDFANDEAIFPFLGQGSTSRSYLRQIEKGAFFASLKIVGRLAEALEVEPAELLKMPSRRGRQREKPAPAR